MPTVRGATRSKTSNVSSRRTKAKSYNKNRRTRDGSNTTKSSYTTKTKPTYTHGTPTGDDYDKARFFGL